MPLTELQVKKAKGTDKPQKLSDGGGLYLLVQPSGGRYWRLKYRFAGVEKVLALGVYPEVTLSDVRERREAARKLLCKWPRPRRRKEGPKGGTCGADRKQF